METWKPWLIGTMNQSATEWHFGFHHTTARGRKGTQSRCNAMRLLITSLLFNFKVISDLGNELGGSEESGGASSWKLQYSSLFVWEVCRTHDWFFCI